MQKVNEYFENNPEETKVFTTSDGFLFKQEMYATAHAATVTDKEVVKHTRPTAVLAASAPAVEVPVSTVTEEGGEIRTKNETVDAPNITDSPLEVEGKVEAIKEAVTDQLETVKDNVDVQAPKVEPAKVEAPKVEAKTAAKKETAPKAPKAK